MKSALPDQHRLCRSKRPGGYYPAGLFLVDTPSRPHFLDWLNAIPVRFEQLAVWRITYRLQLGNAPMTITAKVTAALCLLIALSSCANTIKGVGRDAANTVNATQNAGNRVANAASR